MIIILFYIYTCYNIDHTDIYPIKNEVIEEG